MEFPGNFSSLEKEVNLQNQGSWVTVTPVKPVPSKMPVVTGGGSWLEKEGVSSSTAATNDGGGGFYSMGGNAAENERHRSDGSSSSSFNWTRSLNNNWEEAMAAASVGLNQQNHGNLLNFIDLTSAAGGAQRGENSCHPYSVISYPHIHAQQPAIHARKPATLSLLSQKMLLGGMIPFNADTYSPQIPPYGFPIPYNPPAHHLNSVSKTQFPPTTENGIQNEKVQNSQSLSKLMDFYKQINQEKQERSLQSMDSLLQFSHATSEKNVQNERTQNCKSSSKLTDFGIDERVTQEKNQNGSLPSWGSSLQFAPVTPEKNAQKERAQNDQSPAMFIDFVLDERSNQEKNQGYSLQSCNSPGNDAVENCSNQGLSQSAAVHPSQFAPATPGKNAQMETKQNNQSPLIDLGTEEIANKEKKQGSFLSRVSPGNEVIEIYCDQGLAQSSVILQSQLDEIPNPNKGEINVIDLNKTPQQKPRRKKHRPKVIREQKSAKTPKPVTPKQSGSKENATGRKRNLENQSHKHSKTPLPCAGQPDAAQTGRPHIPSCKRSLNFESETQAGVGGFDTSEICHGELDNQEDVSEAANLQAVEAPQIENQSLGITLDLNSSMTQAPDSYLPSSQNPTLSSPLKRKIPSKENLKNMARKKSNMGIMSATVEYQDNGKAPTGTCIPQEMEPENIQISQVLEKGPESLIESQLDSNTISQLLPTHTKPGFKELNQEQGHPVQNTAFHPSNLIGAHLVPMKTYLEMLQAFQYPGNGSNLNQHYPQIYKKERTKRPKNGTSKVVCDMSSFSMSVAQTHLVQNFPREDRAGIGFHKPQDYGSLPALSQIELKTKKRSNTPTRIRNMASFSASKYNQMLAIHPNWTPGHDAKQGHNFPHGPQSCVEALVANNKSKMVKKKRTKKVSHTVSSTSFSPTNQVQARKDEIIIYCDQQCFIGSTSSPFGQKTTQCNASSPRKLETQDSHILLTNSVHDCGSSSNWRRIVAMVPIVDPIDEIVQRLKNLNINRGDETAATQTENALVPYVRDGTMVPYEGPFDPMKKRRSRPKVDLDMETLRQWKLLMGKDNSENLEGTDEEKEKWWEEERRVFRGRADSFIARMHLVQGDRRFSQWKGSVVDSVVGVFLTQNVSDHLSSSAFMSLAARFPLQSKTDGGASNIDGINIAPPEPDVCVLEFNNTMNWQDKVMVKQMPDQSSMTHHEAELGEENQIASSSESFGSNTLGSKANCPDGTHLAICETGEKMCQQSTENRIDIPETATTGASLAEPEDRRSPEDVSASVVSSQNSTDSTVPIADRVASSSESNSETEEPITSCRSCSFDSHTSFMELLHMAGTRDFQKFYMNENPLSSDAEVINAFDQSQSKGTGQRKSTARLDGLKCPCSSVYQANSHVVHTQNESIEDAGVFLVNYNLNPVELACPASGTTGLCSKASDVTEVDVQVKLKSHTHNIAAYNPDANINKSQISQLLNTKQDASLEIDPKVSNDPPNKMTKPLSGNNTLQICSDLPAQNTTNLLCKAGEAAVQAKSTQVAGNGIHVEALAQNGNFITQQTNSSLVNYKGETLNTVGCSGLTDNLSPTERNIVESSSRDEVYSAEKTSVVETYDALKAKKRKGVAEIKKPVDWDSLRTQVIGNGAPKERSHVTLDSLDWEAVRCAEVGDIAHAIRERGMNNMLAERIKAFLNRMVKEHGSIDLEWLRDVPPDKAKDYLLSIRGLGLKSVECVRLLALQHLAFPVDTNVGRICVRLGWVPLQPLPESLQLHLLELYPVLESIQKYLWPRLCKLDQRTLYELHYQLITFGKVFCTKNRPNCNACPMRGECKHFASAFASARLALPGPEEKSLISSVAPIMIEPENKLVINPRLPAALPPPEANTDVQEDGGIDKCEPIIEEPATPEYIESSGTIEEIAIEETPYAIEDTPYEDPDEIPTIKLNLEELTLHLQNYIQENKMELQDADTSRALVTLTPEAASIPMPKLKNVNRLRTEHQVYELPDTHPLLEGLDPREPDDPCSYLLAIWTPGETAESIKPPETGCNSQASGNLCDKETCFSCNSIREANAETVRGTLLIPCRTAMRGSFPLNGTYFQVNEVFADHDSSLTPIDVPRAWIWNLPRRTVFFGTSIPTIFRGLTTEGIQYCFWRGFVCVRGFDRTKRAPRPLMARLHFPASKLTRSRKGPAKEGLGYPEAIIH